jgi:hypothetical protein
MAVDAGWLRPWPGHHPSGLTHLGGEPTVRRTADSRRRHRKQHQRQRCGGRLLADGTLDTAFGDAGASGIDLVRLSELTVDDGGWHRGPLSRGIRQAAVTLLSCGS